MKLYFLPDRRLPAITSRSGEAGGSPGQEKNNILCALCASVVNLLSGLLRPGILELEQKTYDTYNCLAE
jgi:hypothetical protein